MANSPSAFTIEKQGESSGHCDCCGHTSKRIWGFVDRQDSGVAAYFATWTDYHLNDKGANFDFVIGAWGDGTSTADRFAASLEFRFQEDGSPTVFVVDADQEAFRGLADIAMRRDEVIGTPLAKQVFDIFDAIYLQDDRLFA
jgi:hypothetical protein